MRRILCCVCGIFCLMGLAALPVSRDQAADQAGAWLRSLGYDGAWVWDRALGDEEPLAWIWSLEPRGWIVIAADDALPPLLAYSFTSTFAAPQGDILAELLEADLRSRLQASDPPPGAANRQLWQQTPPRRDPFQQWPPDGYSLTEGWVKTEWDQSAPYNASCPLDPVTGTRSVAGCPAIALAQIVNYHQSLHGTQFSDADDYYHSYAGRNYWIDDDHAARDFPSFPQLNASLDSLADHYRWDQAPEAEQIADLVWACGVAAHQVYTSGGSGTFGVAQAEAAIDRFGFQGCELLEADAPQLWDRLAQNMMQARPALLAVVTPAWDAGHNVVVDGYNTDGFFHLNFGWGGAYSGWYLLPDQIPYNLTVVEGLILDIQPRQYLFSLPDTLRFTEPGELSQNLEVINVSDAPLAIDAILAYPAELGGATLLIWPDPANLPQILPPGQSLICELSWVWPLPRNLIQGSVQIVHEFGALAVPMLLESDLFTSCADATPAPGLSALPNPFSTRLTLRAGQAGPLQVEIYNLRGQKIAQLRGSQSLDWLPGSEVPNGIYFARLRCGGQTELKKLLRVH